MAYELTYTLINNNTEYSVSGYSGEPVNVIIPNEYNGKPVTNLGSDLFSGNWNLITLVVPESIKTIASRVIENCHNLKSVIWLSKIPADILGSFYVPVDTKFYCYSSAIETYKTAPVWSNYADKFVADDMRLYFTMNAQAQKKYFVSKEDLAIQKVTYQELFLLRAKRQLVPGRFYRIIDYQCVVNYELPYKLDYHNEIYILSAGHRFDIVVQALDVDLLSEEARAVFNDEDDSEYFYHRVPQISLFYIELIDDSGEQKSYTGDDWIIENWIVDYGKAEHPVTNVVVPTLMLSGFGYANDELDRDDTWFYDGKAVIEGIQYDRWRERSTSIKFYTSTIVNDQENEFLDECFTGKIPRVNINAWELKYCLDCDIERFSWTIGAPSDEYRGVIYYMKDEWNNEAPYDFKNIMFESVLPAGQDYDEIDIPFYTFSIVESNYDQEDRQYYYAADASVIAYTYGDAEGYGTAFNNKICPVLGTEPYDSGGDYYIPRHCYILPANIIIIDHNTGDYSGSAIQNIEFDGSSFNNAVLILAGMQKYYDCKNSVFKKAGYNITVRGVHDKSYISLDSNDTDYICDGRRTVVID